MKKISWIEGTLFFLALASAILSVTFHYAADNNRGNVDRLNEKYAIIHSFDADEEIEEETEKEQQNEKAAKLCEKLFGIFLVSALCLLLYHRFKRRNNIETQSRVTGEEEKEALSLANEITVNQAEAMHVHIEATSQVAEQSPEAETVKDQRSEGLKEREKASVETNDIGRPKEEAAETFEERTKASKSDDNVPKESRDQDQEANSQDVSMKYMEYLAIKRFLDKEFCGEDDVVFHHLCDDTETIRTTYSPPEKRFQRVCEVATSLYYDENNDHKTAVDVSKAPVFADWFILFLKSFGYSEEQLPKRKNIRKSNYSPRKLIEGTPMYYLDAGSWDDFKDTEKLSRYLKNK